MIIVHRRTHSGAKWGRMGHLPTKTSSYIYILLKPPQVIIEVPSLDSKGKRELAVKKHF